MLIENPAAEWIEWPALVSLPRQKSTSGGSSEREVNELAVMARISPSISTATTVTPVANRPAVWRNARASIGITELPATTPPRAQLLRSELLDNRTHIVRADHVRRRPAVEVVLRHALLGKSLIPLGSAGDIGDQQRLETDALVVAEIVALVELVPAA